MQTQPNNSADMPAITTYYQYRTATEQTRARANTHTSYISFFYSLGRAILKEGVVIHLLQQQDGYIPYANLTTTILLRLQSNQQTNCADTPTIYRLTNRQSSTFDHYHHPTLTPYCYYDRPPLLYLQPINPRYFISSRLPLLLCLRLINHLLPCLQPTDFYCSAYSNNCI